jgi:hypothetical protein
MDDELVLVDQAGCDEAVGESCAAVRHDVVSWLFFEARDFLGEIARGDPGACPKTRASP